jgi:hypothetical protein
VEELMGDLEMEQPGNDDNTSLAVGSSFYTEEEELTASQVPSDSQAQLMTSGLSETGDSPSCCGSGNLKQQPHKRKRYNEEEEEEEQKRYNEEEEERDRHAPLGALSDAALQLLERFK